jgi:hypothetical protein
MKDLNEYIQKLRNLPQYKKLSEEELTSLAQKKLEESEIIDNLTFCVDEAEKKFASDLLNRYLSMGSIENEADKDTLKQLIDLQILAERVKNSLKEEYLKPNSKGENSHTIPAGMLEKLQELNTQILELKEKLGLVNKDKLQSSWIQEWDKLKKKALAYHKEHGGESYTRCPYCNKQYRILMRVNDKEKVPVTFFKGTKLYNKPLFKLYHEKVLTEEQLSEILGVSSYYISLIYTELFLKEEKK